VCYLDYTWKFRYHMLYEFCIEPARESLIFVQISGNIRKNFWNVIFPKMLHPFIIITINGMHRSPTSSTRNKNKLHKLNFYILHSCISFWFSFTGRWKCTQFLQFFIMILLIANTTKSIWQKNKHLVQNDKKLQTSCFSSLAVADFIVSMVCSEAVIFVSKSSFV